MSGDGVRLPDDGDGSPPWDVLSARYLLRSPWRDVLTERVRIHTGSEIEYTYLDVPAAAFVVPLTTDGEIVLLRQYRHPVRAWVWEVVGGGVGPDGPLETARRELAEEIGGRCQELVAIGSFYTASAHLTLRSHVFLALDVVLDGETDREATELLDTVRITPDEAFERARDGRIDEAQCALALLMAEGQIRAHLARRADR